MSHEETMKRIVKDPGVRRTEILDAAERLLEAKGYEQMTIQDIVDALQIAKGTVYYYFPSKEAVLGALVERMGEQMEQLILPIVTDPHLSALEKLLRYFSVSGQWKGAHQRFVRTFMSFWYADENAIVHRKLLRDGMKRFVPSLSQIIRQGVAEGVFTTGHPDQTARMIIALRQDLGDAVADVLGSRPDMPIDPSLITKMTVATAEALERLLGAKAGCVQDAWLEALSQWQTSSALRYEYA
jgi:AcrR family transcriptional regulator